MYGVSFLSFISSFKFESQPRIIGREPCHAHDDGSFYWGYCFNWLELVVYLSEF